MGIEKIVKPVVGAVVIGGLAAGMYFGLMKPTKTSVEFKRVYHNALFQYADTNHDGIITAAEGDVFCVEVLKDKGVLQIHDDWPIYKDGSRVPEKVITEWFRDYKPKQ